MLPDRIKKFVESFNALPSIGPRQATRLAFYIKNLGNAAIKEIAQAVAGLSALKTCSSCFFIYEDRTKTKSESPNSLCDICANPQRKKTVIAIVEKETDLISIEKTKKFNGRYLILGDLKKDAVLNSAQKLRLNSLKSFLKKESDGQAEEIIIAVNPTTYGDLNANIIAQELKGSAKKIPRLGRGIPTGGEIEFADEETLGAAIDKRS